MPQRIWSVLTFGTHHGSTLPEILFKDPDWFFWAVEKGVFAKCPTSLQADAELLLHRARRIRPRGHGSLVVDNFFLQGKFVRFEVVPSTQPVHEGGSFALRTQYIDLGKPRSVKGYDKAGYKSFIRDMKRNVFGSTSARVTRQRAEEFYSNPENFASEHAIAPNAQD